jgi:hypothetical protein
LAFLQAVLHRARVGGLLFTGAFVVVAVVLIGRVLQRRLRAATQPTTFIIARFDDVPGIVRRYRCPCGRRPDVLGEAPTPEGSAVQLECVCGRRDCLQFTLAN